MTEGRKDGMTDKANTKCPLAILWRGHKNGTERKKISSHIILDPSLKCIQFVKNNFFVTNNGEKGGGEF